jgi:hypothetical protein
LLLPALRALALPALAFAHVMASAACGELVRIETHERSQTAYALAYPPDRTMLRGTLVLLAGGEGHLKLGDDACPRALMGNSLVRSVARFHAAGFVTALVDAPSDHHGEEGLAGFRTSEAHAQDLGKIIIDLRARTRLPIWVVGTSRGSISAANVAARLVPPAAPDGVVLTSALMQGSHARKPWVAQTVFDLPLSAIKVPALVMGHAQDQCLRSPPGQINRLAQALGSARKQVITLTGGVAPSGPTSLADCEGRSPHGFLGVEAEMVEAIARFIGTN